MTTRTSQTDPLRVDFLPTLEGVVEGRIGMTFAPGKHAPGIGCVWRRDLDADLDRLVHEYDARLLVSLVEDHELADLGIVDLEARASAVGLAVVRFRIRDGGVPATFELARDAVEAILEAARDRGETVVIHCRAGLGRTGLVAACVLVALGQTPAESIRAVRAARDGTIETRQQEAFVARYAEETRGADRLLSRFRGCLLGGALGDALGLPIEFVRPASTIEQRYGSAAPPRLAYAERAPTPIPDDTQMTLFTAEGVIRGIQRGRDRGICHMAGVVRLALLRWYSTQAHIDDASRVWLSSPGWLIGERRLHVRRAPGNACLSALAAQLQLGDLPTVEAPPNDSKGCGAVMRSAPIGLAADRAEAAFELARDTAVLTHGHPSGYLSAAYFASVICDLTRGSSLPAAMRAADGLLVCGPGHEEMMAVIDNVRRAALDGPPDARAIERIGGGWTGEEALGIALLVALTANAETPDGVAAALWRAVAHSGDSDSTGSLTGNLLGAVHGIDRLPAHWLDELEMRDVVDRVASDLHRAAVLDEELSFEEYPPG